MKAYRHRKRIIICVILVILTALIILFAMTKAKKKTSTSPAAAQPSTLSLSKMDLVTSISATGTIESAATKTVSAQLNNITVSEVLVKVGDTVQSGDTLVRFDLSLSLLPNARERLGQEKPLEPKTAPSDFSLL